MQGSSVCGVRMVSASCSYIFITSVSSSSQENSPSVVKEESHVPEVTCLPFSLLPILFHGMIHKNAFSVHHRALLEVGVEQSQLPEGLQHSLSLLDSPEILYFKGGIVLGREEVTSFL